MSQSNEILNRWRVFCTTDSKYEFTWRSENEGSPTVCPTNTAHSIDASQNRIIEIRNPDLIKIKDEDTPTGGHAQLNSIAFDALPNQVTTHSFICPFPMNINSSYTEIAVENVGDFLTVEAAPNTTVGAIMANVSISDTVITVQQSVIDNTCLGFWIRLDDTTNQEDLGRVIAIDKNNLQLTVETASTQAFSAVTPTFVQITVSFVKNIELGHPQRLDIGKGNIGTSYLPANAPLVTKYDNKHPTNTKRFVAYIEFFY